MKLHISNKEVLELLSNEKIYYAKYSTQIMNLANQNAQGTRPSVVGQMSDLIQEFGDGTLSEWADWYKKDHVGAIDTATERVYKMIEQLRESIKMIDKPTVHKWIEELVIVKTYCGLKFQEAILKKIALQEKQSYRLSEPTEESCGIDGYIGERAVSIKPTTYRIMNELSEEIDVPIIFYEKKKNEIVVEYNF